MSVKVYIDQGHNPRNPNAGSEGNGFREQDLVYRIGIELAELLRGDGRFEVRLSRPSEDTQLGTSTASSLAARVDGANLWGADYFISLHTNASENPAANGSEALVYSLDLRAAELGADIIENLTSLTGLRSRGVKPRPNLYVLRKTKMPAVIVELGFITNRTETGLMAEYPELFARGVYNGLLCYLGYDENNG